MSSTATEPNVELVKTLYEAFAAGDMKMMMDEWADDITWVAMDGSPYSGTHTDSNVVVEQVFTPLAEDWSTFNLEQKQFIDAGDVVVVTGVIEATASESGEDVEAAFAHILTIEHGKVTRFVEYTDTHLIRQVL